jgi:hypothetical protein
MIFILFFIFNQLVGLDYTAADFAKGYSDEYECISDDDMPSLYYDTFALAHENTTYTGLISKRFSGALNLYKYDESIQKIDGFGLHYKAAYDENNDFDELYKKFVSLTSERMLRFYGLIGKLKNEKNDSYSRKKTAFHYVGSFDSRLESAIDDVVWKSGTLSQLKIILSAFLVDHKVLAYASLLKNELSPAEAPFLLGESYSTQPKKYEKRDILYNVHQKKLMIVHHGNTYEATEMLSYGNLNGLYVSQGRYTLPSSNTWIAVSPNASQLITYEKNSRTLISIRDWMNGNNNKEALFFASSNTHIQHGIFLNNHMLLLAFLNEKGVSNIIYDMKKQKFYIVPQSKFQRFLIADESKFSGYFVVGGFTRENEYYKRWDSMRKIPQDKFFSCVGDAFAMTTFSLNDSQPLAHN